MIDFMREGGFGMWLLLLVAVAAIVVAVLRKREARAWTLGAGSFLCLLFGQFGMAAGLKAVSAKYTLFPDKVEAIGVGLGELANNGVLGCALALTLGVSALVTHRQARKAAAA